MPSQEELNYIWKLFSHTFNVNYAFYASDSRNEFNQFSVLYARDQDGWSCIVNLVQAMAARGFAPDRKRIYISSTTPYTGAAEGMCRFFDMQVTRLPAYKGPWSDPMLHFSDQYMSSYPAAVFDSVLPASILERESLDGFVPGNLGPNPVVDLRGPAQTHLHRIYLALAFRRVRRKLKTYERGLAIAAVLVNAVDGRVRAIAHNTKNQNETFHAEVNLTQAFYKAYAAERQGAFIVYSTLQPCPMCAAMLAEKLPNAVVLFGQNDPGGHMARMALQPRVMLALEPGLTHEEEIDDEMSLVHHIKPLRVFTSTGVKAYDDVVARMDSVHDNLKSQGHTSLTRNLYDPNSREAIRGAGRTLKRKAQQYLNGGKATVVVQDYARTQRRQGIQRLMQHLAPIL